MLYTIHNFELRRHSAQSEARRLKELNTVKSRLYTNITHEFRTPLTLILGRIQEMKNRSRDPWLLEQLQLMQKSVPAERVQALLTKLETQRHA